MSIYTIYRACIWLPMVVPAIVILVRSALGLREASGWIGWEVLTYSLLVGWVPYVVLASWATWWVGGRPEAEIRRLMFRAPLLMVAVFVSVALLAGVAVGAFVSFAALAGLGAAGIMILGYAYVGVTVILRYGLGPRPTVG